MRVDVWANCLARSTLAASALPTSNSGPYTSFIAAKAVAMPAAVWKKRRLDRPLRRPCSSASSFSRASKRRCRSVCGVGKNSSLDTTWVGMGDG
jgi:hypothetical protein